MTKEMLLEDHYIDDYVDDHVDREIESCFSASSPNNFFVFAGAGSGKTRSLINTLNFLDKEQGEKLLMKGKQIGDCSNQCTITYFRPDTSLSGWRNGYEPGK